MTFTAAQRVFLFAGLMIGMVATTSHAADEIRAGKWQFTTETRLPAGMQPPPGGQMQQPDAGTKMRRTACITQPTRYRPKPLAMSNARSTRSSATAGR